MVNSEQILEEIKKLQKEVDSHSFHDSDVPNYFFGMITSNLLSYSRGYLFFELARQVKSNSLLIPKDCISSRQYDLIINSCKTFKDEVTYLSHFHRNFLISSWSSFELLMTTMCEKLLDQATKESLLTSSFDDIKQKLKIKVEDPEIRKKFSAKHLTHVPITRKYSALYKIITKERYKRDEGNDKAFLEFLRDFRNTLHPNFIYHGTTEKTYIFNNTSFKFKNGEVVKYNVDDPLGSALFTSLILELKNIVSEIVKSIDSGGVIEYPDLMAQNFE